MKHNMDLELGTAFQEEKDDLKPLTYRWHKALEMNDISVENV